MRLIRFRFNIATATKNGNCIEYSNDGEKVKNPEDIRRVIEEAIKIAFPEAVE
jgi:hypothetical protein